MSKVKFSSRNSLIIAVIFMHRYHIVFCTANTAAAAGGILFFCSYIPYFFFAFRYNTLSLSEKIGYSLSPNVAMAFSCVLIAFQEGNGKQ